MMKFLKISTLIFLFACSSDANVNKALNEEISIKRQEMFQEQKIFQLENDSLNTDYQGWERTFKDKFPANDPIIKEHQISMKAYLNGFQAYEKQLSQFKNSLEKFTKTIESHSLGKITDEQLNEAYLKINLSYDTLQSSRNQIIDNHQTFKDAYEALLKNYQEREVNSN